MTADVDGTVTEITKSPSNVNGMPETSNTEEWVGNGEEEELEEDDEDDEDEDEDAEEIARRLGDQLWADISKAQADRAGTASVASTAATPATQLSAPQDAFLSSTKAHAPSVSHRSKKEEAAITTMKAIIAFTEKDALARSTLASTTVPESQGSSVLDVLAHTVAVGNIPKEVAKTLSHILVSLARSDALFSTLRHSNAPAIQLDRGKRKREEYDEGRQQDEASPAFKRPFSPPYDLQMQITEAVRVISQALGSSLSDDRPLNSSIVSSIQLQLHQVFLFAVTSSARGGPEMNVLQEIGGLIQVIGVLSGIQIAPAPGSHPSALQPPGHPPPPMFPTSSTSAWSQPPSSNITDIGTAVYPCLVPSCNKIFSRLYSFRAHQRIHAVHRPFRCTICPASFARNHDLKRHTKLHDKKAWKCCGCNKIFSRRDAIKRHKNSARMRGAKGEMCVEADVTEVELDKEEREEVVREGRRVKMWNEIVANQISGSSGCADDGPMEEGELRPTVIAAAQAAVMSLHPLLQAHVTKSSGTPSGPLIPPPQMDPTGGQATLASVIARAQLQNLLRAAQQRGLPSQSPAEFTPSTEPSINVDQNVGVEQPPDTQDQPSQAPEAPAVPSLSMYGLSDEQTKMLEEAIANAASAAQAQAEAEAALEEEEDEYDEDELDDQPASEGGMDGTREAEGDADKSNGN